MIKNRNSNQQVTIYDENENNAHFLSEFESQQLEKVFSSFVNTLKIFEKDLSGSRWDRCLYLDAYFPKFLKNFYYLSCAQFNSKEAFSTQARIEDTCFDVSLTSLKSDKRIRYWEQYKEYQIKLRIASKELAYQLQQWQNANLKDRSSVRTQITGYSTTIEDAYALFVKVYFNQQ